jgi:hypothetical protein
MIGDVAAAKSFDPKPTLQSLQQPLLDCYNRARATDAELHGKMKLNVVVNQTGTVVNVETEPGPIASAPGMKECVSDVMKAAHFPKPAGMATVGVPLLFRP